MKGRKDGAGRKGEGGKGERLAGRHGERFFPPVEPQLGPIGT